MQQLKREERIAIARIIIDLIEADFVIEAGEMEALLLGEQLVQLKIAQPDEAHILVYI